MFFAPYEEIFVLYQPRFCRQKSRFWKYMRGISYGHQVKLMNDVVYLHTKGSLYSQKDKNKKLLIEHRNIEYLRYLHRFISPESLNIMNFRVDTERVKRKTDRYYRYYRFYNDQLQLFKIPDFIFNYITLKSIEINDHALDYISKDFEKLVNLETLILDKNRIRKLPKCLTKLKKLVYINLNENLIKKIPKHIVDYKVMDIYLDKNLIKVIPDYIKDMKFLKTISLDDNPIKKNNLPDEYNYKISKDKANITMKGIGSVGVMMTLGACSLM